MPVPGPRTQFAPLPGYNNPGGEAPDRLNQWFFPSPLAVAGQSAGTSIISLRGCRLAAGQVRRLYRQSVNMIAASPPYSWTANGPTVRPFQGAVGVTRALRYMTRSTYIGGGTDNARFAGLHTAISPRQQRSAQSRGHRVTVAAGSVRNRPTVRNRITSFGSRVAPLNGMVPAAQDTGSGS